MKHVYLPRPQDKDIITKYKLDFESKTIEDLVKSYNQSVKTGIVGAHRQGLYLIAMRQSFLDRFGESPVCMEGPIIELLGPIEVVNNSIRILDKKKE